MSFMSITGLVPHTLYPERARAVVTPFDVEPLRREEIARIRTLREAFEARFPPLPLSRDDVLVVSWAEIERQFLDLCAPWDQQDPCYEIRKAAQMSRHESPEQSIRWLFALARAASDLDTPEPVWGTGETLPMP